MTPKVAVLQFPGNNSEYETRRSCIDAGFDAEFFRWNDDASQLDSYDGFIIVGGFAYEDRGRAGLIASMEPVTQAIRLQAEKGKPVLGICNGAQVLVETGLVPGGQPKGSRLEGGEEIPQRPLLLCLARNQRVKDGKLLGVGFYNENIHLKSMARKGRTAFTLDYEPNEIAWSPVAHGEGRYTTSIAGLFDELECNEQIIFKYSDAEGGMETDFPVNPNGAMHNAAAISNVAGNVMAIMPHPERAFKSPMHKIFTSMRKYMEARAKGENPLQLPETAELTNDEHKKAPEKYSHRAGTIEVAVKLIITDNEAQTIQNALRLRGFDVNVRKWIHYEVDHDTLDDQRKLAEQLTASGELLNTNKETADYVYDDADEFILKDDGYYVLVRDMEDAEGRSKTDKLQHHMEGNAVKQIHHAWLWEVTGQNLDAAMFQEIMDTNIFANHHAQQVFTYGEE